MFPVFFSGEVPFLLGTANQSTETNLVKYISHCTSRMGLLETNSNHPPTLFKNECSHNFPDGTVGESSLAKARHRASPLHQGVSNGAEQRSRAQLASRALHARRLRHLQRVLCRQRSLREKPACWDEEQPLLAATTESLRKATQTQCKQK